MNAWLSNIVEICCWKGRESCELCYLLLASQCIIHCRSFFYFALLLCSGCWTFSMLPWQDWRKRVFPKAKNQINLVLNINKKQCIYSVQCTIRGMCTFFKFDVCEICTGTLNRNVERFAKTVGPWIYMLKKSYLSTGFDVAQQSSLRLLTAS